MASPIPVRCVELTYIGARGVRSTCACVVLVGLGSSFGRPRGSHQAFYHEGFTPPVRIEY